jgi:hypothetical protein
MAAMSPNDFYEGFVYEDFSDWKDEPESIRKAFHVAVSAFHLADHYCRYHQIRSPTFQKLYGKDAIRDEGQNKFQEALRNRQPLFAVIQDMATAYKHLYTRSRCPISSGGSIEYVKYEGNSIEHSDAGETEDWHILIRHRTGVVTKFSDAIEAVIQMWSDIMDQRKPFVG